MAVAKPELMPVPFASSGLKNTIPITLPDGADINSASYDAGFPPSTMTPIVSGGKPPKGRDMNGILYDITSHITYINAGGQYGFDAEFAASIGGYPLGAVLQSNDGKSSYVSIVDNNTTDFNSTPSSIGTNWIPWAGSAVSATTIGMVAFFACSAAPENFLVCNGAAVSRTVYPELFSVCGTIFGDGDGSSTFNLPNLLDRFAEGSQTVGQEIQPGLPNVTGNTAAAYWGGLNQIGALGPFYASEDTPLNAWGTSQRFSSVLMDLSRANPIYGASTTVQPPALTLLPCIKFQ